MKSCCRWACLLALCSAVVLVAQSPAKTKSSKSKAAAAAPVAPNDATSTTSVDGLPATEPPPPHTTVVEQIVARINDKIITTTDYANAMAELQQSFQDQAQQSGKPLSTADMAEQQKNLLSILIDNSLLVQRAADLGLNADTETVLQLDKLRQQNHLASMEDLQKAIEAQGTNYQDFEQNIKDQILQTKVVEQDVAPRVSIATPQQIAKYYNEHKSDFVRPDEVDLAEILISTSGKPKSDQTRLKDLADQIQQRAARGEDFGKLVTRYSDSPTASSGGDIGFERRDQLEASLAKTLFDLPVGGVSPVENVSNGFLILKVTAVHHAGQETLAEASNEISDTLYQQAIHPELQTYLAKLRQEAFITVKPGYTDTGAVASTAVDLTHFQRVLPSDLPKQTDSDKNKSGVKVGGGGL